MTRVNKNGYLERRTIRSARQKKATTNHGKKLQQKAKGRCWRDWYLVKAPNPSGGGTVPIGHVSFPNSYIGKRIKLQVVVLK